MPPFQIKGKKKLKIQLALKEKEKAGFEEAHQTDTDYLTAIKAILQYAEVSDCDMEKGSLRCDANISVRPRGEKKLGTKVEIKNMNSFRAVERALQFEIERQTGVLTEGGRLTQETRLWNESRGETLSMRSKEFAHDYRYFPEPDLVSFTLSRAEVEAIRKTLPELPNERTQRFVKDYGISEYDASRLVQEKAVAEYYEACVKEGVSAKLVANWILSELLGHLKEAGTAIQGSKVSAKALAGLIRLIENNTVSGKMAKDILPEMLAVGKSAEVIVKEKGLVQVTDVKLIEAVVLKIIQANPKVVEDFRSGKKQAAGFLVGQVMKETQGKANPKLVNEILEKKLSK